MPSPFLDPAQIGAVPLADALAAIEHELALRDRVYPRLVRDGRMTQAEAARHYAGMVGARRVVLDAMQMTLPSKGAV